MQSARSWIKIALIVQFLGYVFDAVWHGLIQPGVEPETFRDMTRHLLTVHAPLYVGALAVLITTGMALAQSGRARAGMAIAFGGALVSTAAEAWHAYSHLQMDTHLGPIAGSLSFVGFLVAVVATWLDQRRRPRSTIERRRAA
jgi:hypothetical protein